jgi:hypothetical protein
MVLIQANEQLAQVPLAKEWKEKHLRFVKWKLAEAKVCDLDNIETIRV